MNKVGCLLFNILKRIIHTIHKITTLFPHTLGGFTKLQGAYIIRMALNAPCNIPIYSLFLQVIFCRVFTGYGCPAVSQGDAYRGAAALMLDELSDQGSKNNIVLYPDIPAGVD